MRHDQLKNIYTVSRVRLSGKEAYPLHDHNFGELGWVDEGKFDQRVNGEIIPMKKGDFFFIRPADQHSFHSQTGAPFYLVNICFQWHIYEELKIRYFDQQPVYGETQKLPMCLALKEDQLSWVRKLYTSFLKAPVSRFAIDLFLMNILSKFCSVPTEEQLSQAPSWLQQAWVKIQKQEHLRLGVKEFYRLCYHSPEHVSREFRKYTGNTLVWSLLQLKLERAATILAGTSDEILAIIYECGFESVSHFYSSFKKKYNLSPLEYRRREQRTMYPS